MKKKLWLLVVLLLSLIGLLFGGYYWQVIYAKNFGVVLANKIYRSAQPDYAHLQQWHDQYNIKSIINLRGGSEKFPDFAEYGVELTASRVPYQTELNTLIDLLDRAEMPMLIHCKHGTDRTSLASAIALLLNNFTIEQALQQFSISYGFLPFRKQEILKMPIYDYDNWLKESHLSSSKDLFKFWAKNIYKPNYYSVEVQVENFQPQVKINQENILQVKITNTSKHIIPFAKAKKGGVYIARCLYSKPSLDIKCDYLSEPLVQFALDVKFFDIAMSEQLDYKLAPNESITIPITLPALAEKGKYTLEFEFMQRGRFRFNEYGNEPFTQDFEVG